MRIGNSTVHEVRVGSFFLAIGLSFFFPTHLVYATEARAAIDELTMLSITAALSQTPIDTGNEVDDAALAVDAHMLTETATVVDTVVSRSLHDAKNPEEMAEERIAVSWAPHEDMREEGLTDSMARDEEGANDLNSKVPPVTIPGPASLLIADADIVDGEVINPDVVGKIPVIDAPAVIAIAEVPVLSSAAASMFTFTGKQIPTIQRLLTSDGDVIDERLIDESPVISVDEETGGRMITAACGDAYYVVLLYADPEKYERDPESYILKRTYECNGVASYPLADIPPSLPNGTYYLLLGEQGTYDTWLPMTALVEFTINRNAL